LAFDGTCAVAMRFYERILGGRLGVMTNGQSPFADRCPHEHLDRVAHARLELADGTSLYAGDCPPGMPYQGIHGVSIALNHDSVDKARQVFDAIAEGGTVTMAFSDTFWAKKFGMVKDRFGCHWIVNRELIDMRLAA
jgi:PhnB protein